MCPHHVSTRYYFENGAQGCSLGEEKGGDCHRDLCPSEGIGARGTGDLAGPAASAATAEAESARGRAAGAPRANLPSHLTAVNVYPWTHDEVFDGTV